MRPRAPLGDALNAEFGSFERFKKEFSAAAASAEGSGWAALSLCRMTGRPIIMQIEKHNVNVYPGCAILMVLDVWEHAYYLDYKNERAEVRRELLADRELGRHREAVRGGTAPLNHPLFRSVVPAKTMPKFSGISGTTA